jgi:uncharacterized membrane protein YhfC
MRNIVAVIASLIVLVALNLMAQAIFPSIQYQSGNHELATTISLVVALLTGAVVYSLYPPMRQGGGKP